MLFRSAPITAQARRPLIWNPACDRATASRLATALTSVCEQALQTRIVQHGVC